MLELTTTSGNKVLVPESSISRVLEHTSCTRIFFHDGSETMVSEGYDEIRTALGEPSPELVKNLCDKTGFDAPTCRRLLSWKDMEARRVIYQLTENTDDNN